MLSLDAERTEVFAKIREPSVERKRLGGFPARKFGDFVFDGKTQSQLQRSEADAVGKGLRVKFLAKENVRKGSLAVKVGMGVDEVPELFGLEAATSVADPVCPRLQPPFLPRRADIVVIEKCRIPKVEIDGKAVGLDMEKKRGGEIIIQLQGLESLALVDVGRGNLPPFTGVGHGGLSPRKVHDSAKIDAGADVIKDPSRKIGILLRIVNEKGDLR